MRTGEGEERLLARARSGDGDAFAQLVRRFDPGLRVLAFRLLGDRERMDDALQEAYVKAYRALPRFRGDAALGTWLYRIAYNACLDELRRAGAADALSLDAALEQPDGASEVGDRLAERDRLLRALAALPVEQRAVVVLVDAQGFDYQAAGAVLGLAVGTVASRLSHARAALRRALQETEEVSG